jgi:hypothetical protein
MLWVCGQRPCVVHHIHSILGKSSGCSLPPDRDRGFVAKRAVRARVIVKIDPCPDPGTRLNAIGVTLEVNVFVLEAPPQSFDEHIVHPATSAPLTLSLPKGHGDSDLRLFQSPGEVTAGELTALIRVEYLWLAKARQRLVQRLHAETGVQAVGQTPCQHGPAVPVHDRHQIEKPTPHRNIGDVGTPDLIRPHNRQIAQQIRKDFVPLTWFAGVGLGPSATIPMIRIRRCTRLRLIRSSGVDSISAMRRDPRNG